METSHQPREPGPEIESDAEALLECQSAVGRDLLEGAVRVEGQLVDGNLPEVDAATLGPLLT